MLARIVSQRLREYFPAEAADALCVAKQATVVLLDVRDAQRASSLVTVLTRSGCVAEYNARLVGAVVTPAQLAAAAAQSPECAAEIHAMNVALMNVVQPPARLRARDRELAVGDAAHVMGILNVTPDSFYARVENVAAAVEVARDFAADGATLVDIGGQSYAHWNPTIAAQEERDRVIPVVEAITQANVDVVLSIDTWKASVARAALAAGAHLINDCSGLADPDLAAVVAHYDAALVVMHLKGELNVRAASTYTYGDAMKEIVEFLYARTESALAAGVARESIVIDPGLEFGKEPQTDLEILDRFGELRSLGYPILLASSRKSFLGRIFDRPASELLVPSLATAGLGITAGARILRVHDVAETVLLARMYAAVGNPRAARVVER